MKNCLFCDIISGKVSSYTIYEDEYIKVFLDAYPDSPGHTLIIPKKHFKDLSDIDLTYLNHIHETSKKIKKLLEEKLNPNSIILIQNNGDAEAIKHYHLHLIPKYSDKINLTKEEVYNILKEVSNSEI